MEQQYVYKQLNKSDLTNDLFSYFDRYQEITHCWRLENGEWLLKKAAFIEQWDSKDYESLINYLINTLETGGVVMGVFEKGILRGFSSVESEWLGTQNQYLQLSSLHVSYGYRGKGLGKELFKYSLEEAKKLGAEKLYISANSAEETMAFYNKMGCKETDEYIEKIAAEEPFDCQLECTV